MTTTSTARNRRRSSTRSSDRPASAYHAPTALQASPIVEKAMRAGGVPIQKHAAPVATTASHASACHHDGLKSSSNSAAANRQKTTGLPIATTRSGRSQMGKPLANSEAETTA